MKTTSLFSSLLLATLLLPGCDDDDAAAETEASDGSSSTDPTDATDPTGASTTAATDPTDSGASTTASDDDDDDASGADDDASESDATTGASDSDDDATDSDETTGETTGVSACDEGVPCEDAMILDLGLVSGVVSQGAVENTADGDDWVSSIDATAGGIVDAPNNPWLYLRFTDDGLEAVAIDDLQALESEDWDIAAKRFGLRLNSGSSGPSCVTVATMDADYADVSDVPDSATFQGEAFYDGACTLIDDGSGAGGANYALTPWWFYPGCVGVTYTPFVLERSDGRHVKFMVESYYAEGQAECNASGAMGTGSANFVWRWAFLD